MDADKHFNKAVELYNESIGKPATEMKRKLTQALYSVMEGIAIKPSAWAFGFKADTLFTLDDFKGAKQAADTALKLDPFEWRAREVKFSLEIREQGVCVDRFGKFAGYAGQQDLLTGIFMIFLGRAYTSWSGVIKEARNLCASFGHNFAVVNEKTNASRGVMLIQIVEMLMDGKRDDWKKASIQILSAVRDLISSESSGDEETENKLREIEATAGGYLIRLKK